MVGKERLPIRKKNWYCCRHNLFLQGGRKIGAVQTNSLPSAKKRCQKDAVAYVILCTCDTFFVQKKPKYVVILRQANTFFMDWFNKKVDRQPEEENKQLHIYILSSLKYSSIKRLLFVILSASISTMCLKKRLYILIACKCRVHAGSASMTSSYRPTSSLFT